MPATFGTNLFEKRNIESRFPVVVQEMRSGESSQSRPDDGDAGLLGGICLWPLRSILLLLRHVSVHGKAVVFGRDG